MLELDWFKGGWNQVIWLVEEWKRNSRKGNHKVKGNR